MPRAFETLMVELRTSYIARTASSVQGGRDLLRDLRIREKSATRRVVASCCNSALYLDFEKGHWLSIHRARLGGVLPSLQMRIETRFIPNKSLNDVPATRAFLSGSLQNFSSRE
jgi:hypothetical protein